MDLKINIIKKIKSIFPSVISIDALKVAKDCGNIKTVNTVLIGVMAKSLSIDKEIWISAMKEVIPEKLLDVNIKAFEAAYSF